MNTYPEKITFRMRRTWSSYEALGVLAGCLILLGIGSVWKTTKFYQDRFYPNITIDHVDVSGKTRDEALHVLQQNQPNESERMISLSVDDISIASSAGQLGVERTYDEALNQANEVGRTHFWRDGLWRLLHLPVAKHEIASQYQFSSEKLATFIQALAKRVDTSPQEPQAVLRVSNNDKTLTVDPGKTGREVDLPNTTHVVQTAFAGQDLLLPATVASVASTLTPDQVASAAARAKQYVGKSLTLKADDITLRLDDRALINILAFPNGFSNRKLQAISTELTKKINRPPQTPELEYDPTTLKVSKFVPPQTGLMISDQELSTQLRPVLEQIEVNQTPPTELALTVVKSEPTKSLAETNNLGINQQIGLGESEYEHSIPGRIHNVALTATRINNTIVKPGEEFSFVKTLGDVSAATGFAPAYVIKNGRTELGDGGGVCQVSTTLFRALLNAGLKVTKRIPHSYRVSYYELNSKAGVDATVYAGEVDLRFINDTDHAVLIHTQTDSKNLEMSVELYGTSDGRSTEIVDHKLYDFRPAPPTLYQDDPSLPKGQLKQVDFAASGVKASFKNVIKDKNGQVIREDTYFSNYRPWQAIFLRGTG